jgi:hypothetical protein
MSPEMIHGRKHEIEFYEPPSSTEFLDGIAEVIHGPGFTWASGPGICFRCVHISEDKRTYIVEERDIWQSLRRNIPHTRNTKIVEVSLTCEICKTAYRVWKVVGDDWHDKKYWLHVEHCPNCPPMSTDVWLAELQYYSEPPTLVAVNSDTPSRSTQSTIDMADFD